MNSNELSKRLSNLAKNMCELLNNKEDEHFDLKMILEITQLYSIADMISEE